MKIVIDIDEEVYTDAIKGIPNGLCQYSNEAIRNGTPLPKGHGRLIDGDALYKLFEHDNFIWEADSYILTAPTIIEADGGEEE